MSFNDLEVFNSGALLSNKTANFMLWHTRKMCPDPIQKVKLIGMQNLTIYAHFFLLF